MLPKQSTALRAAGVASSTLVSRSTLNFEWYTPPFRRHSPALIRDHLISEQCNHCPA